MGPGVTLINTGEEAAWELKRTLRAMDLLAPEKPAGRATLCASDQPEQFRGHGGLFLGKASPARCSRWTSTGTDPWRAPARITVTSRSLFDGGAEDAALCGRPVPLRPTAAGWDLPHTAACRENGRGAELRIRLTSGATRRAILWTLGPEGYGLPLDPSTRPRPGFPRGLTVAVRTQAVEFSLEEPDRGYIQLLIRCWIGACP